MGQAGTEFFASGETGAPTATATPTATVMIIIMMMLLVLVPFMCVCVWTQGTQSESSPIVSVLYGFSDVVSCVAKVFYPLKLEAKNAHTRV